MAKKKTPEPTPTNAPSHPEEAGAKPLKSSKLSRVMTPGHLVSAVAMTVVVYFCWGIAFAPGGTGSNVVLGLLVALASIYLATLYLGPIVDEVLFPGGSRERAKLLRYSYILLDELERAIKRVEAGKEKHITPSGEALLRETTSRLEGLIVLVESDPDPFATDGLALLRKLHGDIDQTIDEIFGQDKTGGFFGQMRSLGGAFAIALALRAFVMEPFQIPSGSMIPTLLIGDHLFVARCQYGVPIPFLKTPKYLFRWATPKPGDVVVFVAPPYVGHNAGEDWIKRVIAGPGQKVRIENSVIYVDDVPYKHVGPGKSMTYEDYDPFSHWSRKIATHQRERIGDREHSILLRENVNWPPVGAKKHGLECDNVSCTVKPGHIFVMGDNRDNSLDGRVWGAVPVDNVKGRALFIWMSVDGSRRSVELGRFTLPGFRTERLFNAVE